MLAEHGPLTAGELAERAGGVTPAKHLQNVEPISPPNTWPVVGVGLVVVAGGATDSGTAQEMSETVTPLNNFESCILMLDGSASVGMS